MVKWSVAVMIVLVMLLPLTADAGRVLSDEELAGVKGAGPPLGWECEEYDCATRIPCYCEEIQYKCIFTEVNDAEDCVQPGTAGACMTFVDYKCYRVGTHTPDASCDCEDYCLDPEDVGWTWMDWQGRREYDCALPKS